MTDTEYSPAPTENAAQDTPGDNLLTPGACNLYLAACFAEDKGDGKTIKAALLKIARARGISDLAKAAGLTRAGLYRALSDAGDPKLTTLLKIMKALSLTR